MEINPRIKDYYPLPDYSCGSKVMSLLQQFLWADKANFRYTDFYSAASALIQCNKCTTGNVTRL